jgi:HSP20 family protein
MTIEVELPGFSRSDISIESKGVTLTVSAKRTDETRDEVRAQEFSTHHLARSWTLPKTIDVEKIVASYEAGILTLKMPYRGDAVSETRRIEIA